jgi:hypothetical protein
VIRLALTVGALAVLVGCGSTASSPAASATQAPPTVAATATPTPAGGSVSYTVSGDASLTVSAPTSGSCGVGGAGWGVTTDANAFAVVVPTVQYTGDGTYQLTAAPNAFVLVSIDSATPPTHITDVSGAVTISQGGKAATLDAVGGRTLPPTYTQTTGHYVVHATMTCP